MTEPTEENGPSRGRPSKVASVIDEYDLDGLGAELEAAWTAPKDERQSLRDLADLVNRRIVKSVLERGDERPLPGEIDTVRKAIAGETDGATARDVTTRLENRGLAIEDLEGEFVSYQAVRTYLKSVRNVEYEADTGDPVDRTRNRIQGLRGRLRAVTDGQLEELATAGTIDLGDSRVLVNVQVYCEDCGRQFSVGELLDRGGCDCE